MELGDLSETKTPPFSCENANTGGLAEDFFSAVDSLYMKRAACLYFLTLITLHSLFSNQEGYASWYGGKFQGRKTANGEIFDTNELTAAHKTLPFGTLVKVTNIENGKEVVVRINDRGPFVEGRIIDLSRAAAAVIGMAGSGIARVKIEAVGIHESAENPLFDIQVASFGNRGNLERALRRLKDAGFSPEEEQAGSVVRLIIPRVREEDLEGERKKLAAAGFPNTLPRKAAK
jgi:rare lipoprotein A